MARAFGASLRPRPSATISYYLCNFWHPAAVALVEVCVLLSVLVAHSRVSRARWRFVTLRAFLCVVRGTPGRAANRNGRPQLSRAVPVPNDARPLPRGAARLLLIRVCRPFPSSPRPAASPPPPLVGSGITSSSPCASIIPTPSTMAPTAACLPRLCSRSSV